MPRTDYLFNKQDLRAVLEAQQRRMSAEIDGIDGDRLLKKDSDAWAEEFAKRFAIRAGTLDEAGITVEQEEAQLDVSGDPSRVIFDRGRPFYVRGVSVSFFVPFEGDEDLLNCQPSTYTLNPPRGQIQGKNLVVTYTRVDHDAAAIRTEFQRDLGRIKSYLECIARDLEPYNASVRDVAKSRIESRRQTLVKDQAMAADVGYPQRRRPPGP